MQKITKTLFLTLMIFNSTLTASEELSNAELEEIYTANEDNSEGNQVSLDQEQLLTYLEDSMEFETQKLKLKNQLEIEKLKSEIAKLKDENKSSDSRFESESIDYYDNNSYESEKNIPQKETKPTLLLSSDVGGITTFGVSVNDKLTFVRLNKEFKDNSGKKYYVRSQNGKYVILGK